MTDTRTFELNTTEADGIQTFRLSGRLMDQAQSEELIDLLDKSIDTGYKKIILDLEGLNYMNSTGLNTVISVMNKAKKAQGTAIICNMNPMVKQLFSVTKLDSVFTIVDDHQEAVNKLKS
jgi:anti-sigma B factor antagonist